MSKMLVGSGAAVLLLIGAAIWVVLLQPDLLRAHWITSADLHVAEAVFIVGGLLAPWKALRMRKS